VTEPACRSWPSKRLCNFAAPVGPCSNLRQQALLVRTRRRQPLWTRVAARVIVAGFAPTIPTFFTQSSDASSCRTTMLRTSGPSALGFGIRISTPPAGVDRPLPPVSHGMAEAPNPPPCQRRTKMSQKWRVKMSHPAGGEGRYPAGTVASFFLRARFGSSTWPSGELRVCQSSA